MIPRRCILGSAIAIALATSSESGAKDCRIKGDDAVKTARANGFRFEARISDGKGTCSFKDGRFLAIASLAKSQPVGSAASAPLNEVISCVGTGFVGRRISTRWKLKAMSIAGGTFAFQSPPQTDTDNPTFSIAYSATPGTPVVLGIDFLVLEGPDCDDWPRAFTEARSK